MSLFEEFEQEIKKIENSINVWIDALGVGYNHFAVLYSLMAAEVQNVPCTQKHIAEEWYLPKQTVFNICKEFREKGWIEFQESAHDKREKILCLTDIGKAHAEAVYQPCMQFSERIFAAFGKRKTAQLFALLHEFGEICQTEAHKIENKS